MAYAHPSSRQASVPRTGNAGGFPQRRHGASRRETDAAQIRTRPSLEESPMLRLAVMFLVIALIAALFGFGLVGSMAYGAAKILFFIFIVLAVLSFLGGALRTPPV